MIDSFVSSMAIEKVSKLTVAVTLLQKCPFMVAFNKSKKSITQLG